MAYRILEAACVARRGAVVNERRGARIAAESQMYYCSDMNETRPKKILTVGAREANQRFSHFLREVEQGNEVVITRNGKEVARLIPWPRQLNERARLSLIEKVMKATKKGLPITHGNRRFSRDEMYER